MTWIEEMMIVDDFDDAEDDRVKLNLFYDMHGSWLQVPLLMLAMLDFKPNDFSKFSYISNEWIYLEEDLDAHKFLRRLEFVNNERPKVIAHDCGEEAVAIRQLNKNHYGSDVPLH